MSPTIIFGYLKCFSCPLKIHVSTIVILQALSLSRNYLHNVYNKKPKFVHYIFNEYSEIQTQISF